MPRPKSQPAYRLHKARNCAVVTVGGKNHYLGPWQSPESHEKYAALIAEWRRAGGTLPAPAATALTSAAPAPLTVRGEFAAGAIPGEGRVPLLRFHSEINAAYFSWLSGDCHGPR